MNVLRTLLAAILATNALAGLAQPAGRAAATFAGGCFWCMEPPYDALPGVISTTSGYMEGSKRNPTYEEVTSGATGHAEVVQVIYDPKKVSYQKLLEVFWKNVDPTVRDRQFCDIGSQYRTSIFYHTEEQQRLADASKAALMKTKPFKDGIVTPVASAGEFWPAEDYPSGLLYQKPGALQVLPHRLRTRCPSEAALGQCSPLEACAGTGRAAPARPPPSDRRPEGGSTRQNDQRAWALRI